MSKTVRRILGAAAVLALGATFLGCDTRVEPLEANEPVELKTYTVPVEHQEELRRMLMSALGGEEDRVGRVTKGPGGTLLVVAQPRIQAGVQAILEKGFEAPPSPEPVKMSYWFLVGRPSRGAEPFSVVDGRGLPQLAPVLGQIANAQGPTEFALLEQIQLTSMNQEHGHTSGKFVRVSQRATRTGEQVIADVEFILHDNAFQSQVMLEPNQFLVLGQTGYSGRRGTVFPDVQNEDVLTLYYVLAADLES